MGETRPRFENCDPPPLNPYGIGGAFKAFEASEPAGVMPPRFPSLGERLHHCDKRDLSRWREGVEEDEDAAFQAQVAATRLQQEAKRERNRTRAVDYRAKRRAEKESRP